MVRSYKARTIHGASSKSRRAPCFAMLCDVSKLNRDDQKTFQVILFRYSLLRKKWFNDARIHLQFGQGIELQVIHNS